MYAFVVFGPLLLAVVVIGSRVYNLVSYFINTVLHDLIFDVNNSNSSANDVGRKKTTRSVLYISVLISSLLFSGVAATSEELLSILVGEEKAIESSLFLKFCSVLGVIEVTQFVVYSTILSTTKSMVPIYLQLFRFSVISIVFLFVKGGGVYLVCLSLALSAVIALVYSVVMLHSFGLLKRRDVLFFLSVIASSILVFIILSEVSRWAPMGSKYASLLGSAALGCSAYIIFMFIFRPSEMKAIVVNLSGFSRLCR